MWTKVLAMSVAGSERQLDCCSTAQLEGMIALIYTDMKRAGCNDHYNIETVVIDWFEAVWEVTPYEAHQYAADLIESVYNVCFVDAQ